MTKPVQALLAKNRVVDLNKTRAKSPSQLAGILVHEDGKLFKPSHSTKNGVRRRYYIHSSCTLPSNEIEGVVIFEITRLLSTPTKIVEILDIEDQEQLKSLLTRAETQVADPTKTISPSILKSIIQKVIFSKTELQLHIIPGGLKTFLSNRKDAQTTDGFADYPPHIITLQIQLKRCGHGKKLIVRSESLTDQTSVDTSLVKLIARSHMWLDQMKTGSSYKEIAEKEKVDERLVSRTIRCAFLAPDITSAILKGQEPTELSSQRLLRLQKLPASWDAQRKALGFN